MRKYIYESKKLKNYVEVNNIKIGGDDKVIIAGPCSFGSYEELYKIAVEVKGLGIKFLRAGAFKPRKDPYTFQGLGDIGIEMLLRIRRELGLYIVTELMTIEQVRKYGDKIDIIQIGSRNMYNYDLLKEVGKLKRPVLLKRGLSASFEEWLLAAEYILKEGNLNVILCERGIKGYSTETRNVLDLQAIPYIKSHTNLPIIIDPSHASGHSYMIEPMSKAAIAGGCDGLIIEVHTTPKKSLTDKNQIIDINTLNKIIEFKDKYQNLFK